MKKILIISLLAMVSWALVGTPAQAAETSHHSLALSKHKKKHKKHKKHKRFASVHLSNSAL